MIIPSIDLINGNVVRLYQGCYKQIYNYNQNPFYYFKHYLNQGAKIIHIVDLNGAKNPEKRQISFLTKLLKTAKSISIQIGGGIRNTKDIEQLLNIGVKRIVFGSIAATQPKLVKQWFQNFDENSLVLATDVRINLKGKYIIEINGWTKSSNFTLDTIIQQYQDYGLKHVLCTDISKDGTLSGINVNLYHYLCNKWPNIQFQASGGISSLQDIKKIKNSGVQNLIIGRAFLENKITVKEAIKCWQNE